MPDTCSTCKWFVRCTDALDRAHGDCHRFPPIRVIHHEHVSPGEGSWFQREPEWAFVSDDDFCGEHEPRPGTQEDDDGD